MYYNTYYKMNRFFGLQKCLFSSGQIIKTKGVHYSKPVVFPGLYQKKITSTNAHNTKPIVFPGLNTYNTHICSGSSCIHNIHNIHNIQRRSYLSVAASPMDFLRQPVIIDNEGTVYINDRDIVIMRINVQSSADGLCGSDGDSSDNDDSYGQS